MTWLYLPQACLSELQIHVSSASPCAPAQVGSPLRLAVTGKIRPVARAQAVDRMMDWASDSWIWVITVSG